MTEADQHEPDAIEDEVPDEPSCSCPPLTEIVRAGAEEKPVPSCPIHRPETGYRNNNVPLNGTELTKVLRRELGSDINFVSELRDTLNAPEKPPTTKPPTPDTNIFI